MAETATKVGLQRQWRRPTMLTVPAAVVDHELPEIGFYALGVYLAACRLADGGQQVSGEEIALALPDALENDRRVEAAVAALVARDLLVDQHNGTYLVQEPRR
jgi:hypothetical protein